MLAIVTIRNSSSCDLFELCSSHEGTVIRFFLKFKPRISFASGNKHIGGTCSLEVAGAPHL
ncbi:hypothetical protein D3C87_1891260 [compost metagenome]